MKASLVARQDLYRARSAYLMTNSAKGHPGLTQWDIRIPGFLDSLISCVFSWWFCSFQMANEFLLGRTMWPAAEGMANDPKNSQVKDSKLFVGREEQLVLQGFSHHEETITLIPSEN